MFSKNLRIAWKCLIRFKIRASITHFLNAFLSTKQIWIIHPEPTLAEQKRIFKAYTNSSNFKQKIIRFFTILFWFKTPENLTQERLKHFKK